MFERPHHQRVATVLGALNGPFLRRHACLFGGGTAIALQYGEFRQSVDIDFLVSEVSGFRALRQLLVGPQGVNALALPGAALTPLREVRADQYGLRTMLEVERVPIKFEIVLEARIALEAPVDELCGVAVLAPLDLVTTKLLANSDRWADPSVFSRDVIDLAMMAPSAVRLKQAIRKAREAYGESVLRDLTKAIAHLRTRPAVLRRCLKALEVDASAALVLRRLVALRRRATPSR